MKVSLNELAPLIVVWFRFCIAFALLFAYFLARDRKKLAIIKKPPLLLIVAAVCLTINYMGFANGINLTSPGSAQIFIQMGSISLAVVGVVVYKEKLSARQMLGFIVAGIGLVFFYRDQLKNLLGSEDIFKTGVYWLILGGLAWTGYAALQKKLVQKYHAQQLNLIIYGLPILILFPFVDFSLFKDLSLGLWLLLIFLGLNTIVAYGCLAEAFKYTEANKISVIITLNPIITLFAMWVLGNMEIEWIDPEVITIYGLIGAALVIFGVIMVIISKKINFK